MTNRKYYTIKYALPSRTAFQIESHRLMSTDNFVSKIFGKLKRDSEVTFELNSKGSIDELVDKFKPDKFPPKGTEVGYGELFKSAYLTDFISGDSINSNGFVINEKAKNLIENLNVGKKQFYPFEIHHNDKVYKDYYYFQWSNDASDFVDYEKSKFYKTTKLINIQESDKEYIDILSKTDFEEKRVEAQKVNRQSYIKPEEIILFDNFKDFDLFTIRDLRIIDKFVSQRFFDTSLANKINGLELKYTELIKHTGAC